MFKKRGNRDKNIRKRERYIDEEDLETIDELKDVKTLKLEQQFRKKKIGIDTKKSVISKTSNNIQNTKDNIVNDGNTVTTLSGTQFHSTIDYGLKSKEEAHGDILEKYIEERLSSSNSNINKNSESHIIDTGSSQGDIKKIIEETVNLNKSNNTSSNTDEDNADKDMRNAAAAVLAEVQLPISSRIQNIKKTEEMLKQRGVLPSQSYSHSRSHSHQNHVHSHSKSKDFEVMKRFTQKMKKR